MRWSMLRNISIVALVLSVGLALSAAAARAQTIYVANFDTSTIGEYTMSGAVVNSSLISGLSNPSGIAVSGSNLFVTNAAGGTIGAGTIGEYTTSGAVVNASLVSGLMGHPVGIAVTEPVPEPSTIALLGALAVGLLGYVWRRRKA